MNVIAGARTDVGRLRENNQDAYLVAEPLYGIADGMGGHAAGDVAAQTAVSTVRSLLESNPPKGPDDLARYLEKANASVWRKATEDADLQGMGTTFTLIHIDGDTAALGHVGDSRAYMFREGRLRQITKDHTLVQRMVDEGRIRAEEAAHHPQRNVISRALGIDNEIEVDVSTVALHAGDRLLICSDGLTSMLSDERIASMLQGDLDPDALAERMITAANEAGGEDNITVVILDVVGNGGSSASNPAPRVATPPPPPSSDDTKDGDDAEMMQEREPRRIPWRTIAWIAIPLLLLGAGFAAAKVTLANSWFVGADEEGTVTIYQGIPEEILGLRLQEIEEASDLDLEELPAFLRADVSEGIKVSNLEEARETVDDLVQRSEDFGTPRDR